MKYQQANDLLVNCFIKLYFEIYVKAMITEGKVFEQTGPNDIIGRIIKRGNKLLIKVMSPTKDKIIKAYIAL